MVLSHLNKKRTEKKSMIVSFRIMFLFVLFSIFPLKADAADITTGGDLRMGPAIISEGESPMPDAFLDDAGNTLKPSTKRSLYQGVTGEHYKGLSDNEKILYNAIYGAVTSKKYLSYSANYSQMTKTEQENSAYIYHTGDTSLRSAMGSSFNYCYNRATEACYFDHPGMVELYMCYPVTEGTFNNETNGVKTYSDYLVFQAYYDETKFQTIDAQITEGLTRRLAEINAAGLVSQNKAVTEMNVHDYYAQSLVYDNKCARNTTLKGYFNLSHTAWGALYADYAVCDGYATGFEMIMDSLGIDCMTIAGDAGGGHAWNIVRLDGSWYEVDTTWAFDPSTTTLYHSFFNRTTEEYEAGISLMANSSPRVHNRKSDSGYCGFEMPKATGTLYTADYINQNFASELKYEVYTPVTGIAISETQKTLKIGESYTPVPVITPANATRKGFTVTSSNTAVLKVFGNTAYAVAAGSSTLTLKSVDGDFSASVTVTVEAEPVKEETTQSGENAAEPADNKDSKEDNNSDQQEDGTDKTQDETDKKQTKTVTISGITYIISNGTAQISDGRKKKASTISIPAAIKSGGVSYEVTAILPRAFKNNKSIKSVTGGKNITSIEKEAFRGCTKLKSIKLGSIKITSIGIKAFYGCKKTDTIIIKCNKLITIGKNAFTGTKKGVLVKVKCSKQGTYKKIVNRLKKSGLKKARFKKIK